MRLKKKLITLVLGMAIMGNSLMALEVTPIEKTFSIDNIGNTVSTTSNIQLATYAITKDNKVRAIGSNIYGSSVRTSTSVWVDILDKPNGNALTNVVKIFSCSMYTIFLTSNGECYIADSDGTKLLNAPEKISNAGLDNSGARVYFIGESGSLYYSTSFTPVTGAEGVKFKDVAVTSNTSNAAFIDENGCLYGSSSNTTVKKNTSMHSPNIKKIVTCGDGSQHYYMLTNLNELYYLHYSSILTSTYNKVNFYGTTEPIIVDDIYSIKPTSLNVTTNNKIIVKTNQGYWESYKESTTSYSINKLSKAKDVLDSTILFLSLPNNDYGDINNSLLNICISEDGTWNVKGTYSNTLGGLKTQSQTYVSYREDWMNDTNIIPESKISTFDIVPQLVYDRKGVMGINFSLITPSVPTAFNIYFSQALDLSDRTKWVDIAKNVPTGDILTSTIDSGFKDDSSAVINKNNYTYKWTLPDRNLVDIVVIVEPVY